MELEYFIQIRRFIILVLLFSSALVTRLITKLIDNYRLSKLFNKLFKLLTFFLIMRIIAFGLDKVIYPGWDLFSTIVGLATYLSLFLLIFSFYYKLRQRNQISLADSNSIIYSNRLDKDKVNNLINSLFDELRVNQGKAHILHASIENSLKKYD